MIRRRSFLSLFAVLIGAIFVLAQDVATCTLLVDEFLDDLNRNCANININTVCYGVNALEAEFYNPGNLPPGYFSQPGDIADVINLLSLRSSVFDPNIPEWGIAIMKTRPNISNALPGQAATYILMGDVELRNAVPPEIAFLPDINLSVTTSQQTTAYFHATTNSNTVRVIPGGSEAIADAITTDGAWVRVAYDGATGWIPRDSLIERSRNILVGLQPANDNAQVPMQSFIFETGIGASSCGEAPSAIVVEGSDDFQIAVEVNGVEIAFTDSVALTTGQTTEGQQTLEIYPLKAQAQARAQQMQVGYASLNYSMSYEAAEQALAEAIVCVLEVIETENGTEIVPDCDQQPLDASGQQFYNNVIGAFGQINIGTILDPTPTMTPTATPEAGATCENPDNWTGTHSIMSGETLSSIASLYNTDTNSLISVNCIENPDLIVVGQTLIVPSIATPTPLPTVTVQPTPLPATGDLSVTITSSNANPLENDVVTFTITVSNAGANTANTVTVSNTLNALSTNFVIGGATPSGGVYNAASGIWTLGALNTGVSETLTISATVIPTSAGSSFAPSVSVSAASPTDPNTANNSASASVTVGYGNIIVTSLSDTVATDGVCSLREAMRIANATDPVVNTVGECRSGKAGADIIDVSVSGTLVLSNVLNFLSDITINGNGITVDANNATRVFDLTSGTSTLNSVNVTKGTATDGGCISNSANLTINGGSITSCVASVNGGGINNLAGAVLTINGTSITGNTSGWGGGGLYNRGSATVNNGQINNNITNSGVLNVSGGGIYNYLGTLIIDNTTISGNQLLGTNGDNWGGGIMNNQGTVTIRNNSTITGNSAGERGGGIDSFISSITVQDSTITGNTPDDCGPLTIDGGGNTSGSVNCPW